MQQRMFSHPYAQLIRLDKPVGIWLLMFPCWWGVLAYSESIPLDILLLFFCGACAMRSAGCVINDMTDRNIDKDVARTATRPLAAGTVSMQEAYAILAVLLLLAAGIALTLGSNVLMMGLLWLPLVIAYPRMKRITWWPQAFLGITFGAGPLFGAMAMAGAIPLPALILYIGTIAWVIGYDTIYACQDIEDDSRIGVKSTARLFGSAIKQNVGICYVTSALCLIFATSLLETSSIGYAALLIVLYRGWLQWQSFEPDNPEQCLKCFKDNAAIGGIACFIFV